jgi:hypothetical protein
VRITPSTAERARSSNAQNRFDLTASSPENVASLLEQIGSKNAAHIRHVCVNFPSFCSLDLGNIVLEEDSIGIFASIYCHCTNLSTLTTSLDSTNAMELGLNDLDNPNIVTEALTSVNTCFKTIPSIREIVVEVYEGGPSEFIRNT